MSIWETRKDEKNFSEVEIDREIKESLDAGQRILNNAALSREDKINELEIQTAYLYNRVYNKMKVPVWAKRKDVEIAIKLLQEEIDNLKK
jgi:hypothetical protein